VRGIANSKIGFGDLILLLRYFFKLKVSTHPNYIKTILSKLYEMIQCEVVCFDKNNVKFITLFKIKYAQFI
ncbi:hypothetical protein HNP31_003048, partial [Acinetobacter johnsonii]|nr:hypothetical protein [Acinetobacter johnsonii]